MTNAERIARDICLLAGRYERGEITAKELTEKAKEVNTDGCAGCAYDCEVCFLSHDITCTKGQQMWLDAEV